MDLPQNLIDFLTNVRQLDIGPGVFEVAPPEKLEDFQVGYAIHGLTNEVIEGWSSDWLVIASMNADPLIFNKADEGIYFARHGCGYWQPDKLFTNIDEAVSVLMALSREVETIGEDLNDDDWQIKPEHIERLHQVIRSQLSPRAAQTLIDCFEIQRYD